MRTDSFAYTVRAVAIALVVFALTGCANVTRTTEDASLRSPSREAEATTLTGEDATAWLDGLLPAALEREGIAGATVAVVADGEIIASRGFGDAGAASPGASVRAVEPETTLFRIGSVSKLVTATAVMQLVERGDLRLDAPVQDYLDFSLPVRFEEPITMRHLLTHTAGFEDELAGLITAPGGDSVTLREAVAVDPPEQIFEPGSTPAYSNYSDGLAAYVVERITGEPFETYVQREIFDRADMQTATLEQPLPAAQQEMMSAGFRFAGSEEVPFEVVSPAPAGAISATATDMGRFMLAQLGASSEPVLAEATLEQMHAPALGEADLGGLAAGPRMTLGFFERDRNGHRILSHAGDLTAFHAQLEIYPDDDAGIFISLNSSGLRSDSSTVIREAVTNGFADRYFPDRRPAVTPTETATDHAAAITGTYQLSRRGESTFIRAFFIASSIGITDRGSGKVAISAVVDATGSPVDFVEVEPWVWQEIGGHRVIAVDQQDGTVRAVGLDPAFTLEPISPSRASFSTVALGSLLVLLGFLVALPVGVVIRRFSTQEGSSRMDIRLSSWMTWAAVACLAVGALPWWTVAQALLTDGPAPSDLAIRAGQALFAIAAMGVIPATWRVVLHARRASRHRWRDVALGLLLVASFAGWIFVILIGGIMQLSLSY